MTIILRDKNAHCHRYLIIFHIYILSRLIYKYRTVYIYIYNKKLTAPELIVFNCTQIYIYIYIYYQKLFIHLIASDFVCRNSKQRKNSPNQLRLFTDFTTWNV